MNARRCKCNFLVDRRMSVRAAPPRRDLVSCVEKCAQRIFPHN